MAFHADALGLTVNLTTPGATSLLPLPNAILDGRHLPLRRTKPLLHLPPADANTPNLPFWNVTSQLNVPGSATDPVNVIDLVLGFAVAARLAKWLFGIRATRPLGEENPLPGGLEEEPPCVLEEPPLAAAVTANDCCAWGAAAKVALPAWSASIVQVPPPKKLTVEPETVHTALLDGSIVYVTGKPELALADAV